MKRQKELKRMQKAQEKMARRHGKKKQVVDIDQQVTGQAVGLGEEGVSDEATGRVSEDSLGGEK